MEQKYRVGFNLRRKSESPLGKRTELKSEDFGSDEEFVEAVASEILSMLEADREYLAEREG